MILSYIVLKKILMYFILYKLYFYKIYLFCVTNKYIVVIYMFISLGAKVLITGVTGQDGSNMVRYLLKNTNCKIYGAIRRLSVSNHANIEDINDDRFELVHLDLLDQQSIFNNVKIIRPDYIINFAAQSFVGESWNSPIQTFTTNTLSVTGA